MSLPANFPTSLDALANPTATTNRDDSGFELHAVVSRIHDILEALEAKVGIGASVPSTAGVLRRTAPGSTAWGQVAAGDYASGSIASGDLAAGATMKQITKTTLASDATSNIDFTSIPQTYSALVIDVVARGTAGLNTDVVVMRFGAGGSLDSGANYDDQLLYGNAATAGGAETFAATSVTVGSIPGNTASANEAGAIRIEIPNYAGTTFSKKGLSLYAYKYGTSAANMVTGMHGFTWRNTGAIDTIRLLPNAAFKAGSTFVLWGLP